MTATLTRAGFTVEAKPFAAAVAWAAKAVPQRPTVPLLGGVLLELSNGILALSGFDGDTATRATVEVNSDDTGRWVVSGRLLDGLVKTFGAKPVQVCDEGPRLSLRAGSAHVTLPTMPQEDYPTLPVMPQPIGTVDAADFARHVSQVAPATGGYATPAQMVGLNLRFEGDQIQMLASDKYRAGAAYVAWKPSGAHGGEALVQSDLLARLAPILAEQGSELALSHSDGLLGLSGPHFSATVRLMALDAGVTTYPDFARKIPRPGVEPARIVVAELMESIKRAELVAPQSPVRLSFAANLVTVRATGDDGEVPDEEVACEYGGPELTIATNPKYLATAMACCGTPTVELRFTDPKKPIHVTAPDSGAEGYRHILMPVRIGG